MTAELIAEVDEKQSAQQSILVVDDQPDVRDALRLLLKGAGLAIRTVGSPEQALAAAAGGNYSLVIVDMNYTWDTTSGVEGLRLVDALRAQNRNVPIIAMTGWSTIELAVEAMQHGACDFIPKPWDNSRFVATVRKHLASEPVAPRPLDAELAIARKVQRKLLPQPRFSAYRIECECASLPAGQIGGDLYDFFDLAPGISAFMLGDVSGKGLGAALLMANLQATIRGQADLANAPAKLMQRVNGLFFESTRPEHFASLFYAVYDANTRTIRYANCGHPSAVLLRANGECELLEASATVLGAFRDRMFEERAVAVRSGDRLVLFSDGFSEAQLETMPAEECDRWAVETIESLGRSCSNGLAGAAASMALAAMTASGGKQADDITVMDVRVL
jgi:phosphoserine phosphatase RsbU/P